MGGFKKYFLILSDNTWAWHLSGRCVWLLVDLCYFCNFKKPYNVVTNGMCPCRWILFLFSYRICQKKYLLQQNIRRFKVLFFVSWEKATQITLCFQRTRVLSPLHGLFKHTYCTEPRKRNHETSDPKRGILGEIKCEIFHLLGSIGKRQGNWKALLIAENCQHHFMSKTM